jgi:hypothetical protein
MDFGCVCTIRGVGGDINELENSVQRILGSATPSWMVNIVGRQDKPEWAIDAGPIGGPKFHTDLGATERNSETVERILKGFLLTFKSANP